MGSAVMHWEVGTFPHQVIRSQTCIHRLQLKSEIELYYLAPKGSETVLSDMTIKITGLTDAWELEDQTA